MNQSLDEVLREVRAQGVAVPFTVVVARLRRRGAAVTEPVLERALRAADSGVRVLDPWIGVQAELRPLLEALDGPGIWVVPVADPEGDPVADPEAAPASADVAPRSSRPGTSHIHRALRCLARELDERSTGDVARWVGLVQESRRLRGAA